MMLNREVQKLKVEILHFILLRQDSIRKRSVYKPQSQTPVQDRFLCTAL